MLRLPVLVEARRAELAADARLLEAAPLGLRHGTVWINDYHPYVPQAEWGGFKRSGIGRELGLTGLDEYREAKHIWQNIDPQPQYWFSHDPGTSTAD